MVKIQVAIDGESCYVESFGRNGETLQASETFPNNKAAKVNIKAMREVYGNPKRPIKVQDNTLKKPRVVEV